MRVFNIAERARYRQFWQTPYRTGNLARSIGVLQVNGREMSYKIFNANGLAPYGEELNEQQVRFYKGYRFLNRHYKWIDNFADAEADLIDIENGTQRG